MSRVALRELYEEPPRLRRTRSRPSRRTLAIWHGKVLGKPCEEHIPPLIADRSRRVRQQPFALPGRLPAVLLQEFHDQSPARLEIGLGRDEGREPRDVIGR